MKNQIQMLLEAPDEENETIQRPLPEQRDGGMNYVSLRKKLDEADDQVTHFKNSKESAEKEAQHAKESAEKAKEWAQKEVQHAKELAERDVKGAKNLSDKEIELLKAQLKKKIEEVSSTHEEVGKQMLQTEVNNHEETKQAPQKECDDHGRTSIDAADHIGALRKQHEQDLQQQDSNHASALSVKDNAYYDLTQRSQTEIDDLKSQLVTLQMPPLPPGSLGTASVPGGSAAQPGPSSTTPVTGASTEMSVQAHTPLGPLPQNRIRPPTETSLRGTAPKNPRLARLEGQAPESNDDVREAIERGPEEFVEDEMNRDRIPESITISVEQAINAAANKSRFYICIRTAKAKGKTLWSETEGLNAACKA